MRVYISGPMTGLPDRNCPAFTAAAKRLADDGHEPINPAITGEELTEFLGTPDWHDYMCAAIEAMRHAEGITYLPGWQKSPGARIEAIVAERMGLEVVFLGHRDCSGNGIRLGLSLILLEVIIVITLLLTYAAFGW